MTAKKKVIIDNDNFLLYYPLTRDWCSYHEPWCKGFGGEQNMSEKITKFVNNSRGSVYILVKKGKHPSTHILIGNRVPLKFDGIYTMVDDDLTGTHIKKFFSQHKSMSDFLKLKYDLKERIKYDVQFTEEEINNWAGINEFSKTVKGIIDNKIHYNGLFEHIGEELEDYEKYSWKPTNQIKFGVNGIELFIDNDQYMNDILDVSENDEYYYKRAMGVYYYDDGEEVNSEELDYMSCWFEPETVGKLSKLFALFGIDKSNTTTCSDYEETEINNFLIENFPSEWDQVGWDILSEAGYGLTKERTDQARQYIDDEVAFEFDVGNSQTTMEITHNQLLFLIHAHELEDLSGLIDPKNSINELDASLYDSWYDSYDFGDAYDEIDQIFSRFLDSILENTEDLTIRKNNGELLKSIVKQVGFQIRTYNSSYYVNIDNNSITLYNIDLIDGTATLTKVVEVEPTEETPASPPGATKRRKNFDIEIKDIPLYVDRDNIFADPTEEKDIKTTP